MLTMIKNIHTRPLFPYGTYQAYIVDEDGQVPYSKTGSTRERARRKLKARLRFVGIKDQRIGRGMDRTR